MARGQVRTASIAWPTRDELTQEQKRETEREERGRKLRDALTYNMRQGGTLDQVRGLLSPAGRELVDALGVVCQGWRFSLVEPGCGSRMQGIGARAL